MGVFLTKVESFQAGDEFVGAFCDLSGPEKNSEDLHLQLLQARRLTFEDKFSLRFLFESNNDTVDGRNPAPPGTCKTL